MLKVASILAVTVALCGCAARQPAQAPNTPLAGLQRIAALPFYGQPFDIGEQDALAALWSGWWAGHYPGATWVKPSEAAQSMAAARVVEAWRAEQAAYMATGQWPDGIARGACQATGAQAIMQTTVFAVSPSAARMSVAVYSCVDGAQLWRRARDLDYTARYTQTKMVEYTLGYISDSLGER